MIGLARIEILICIALVLVLFGCSAPPPTIEPTAAPSAIPSETVTSAPTATPTILFPDYPNITPEFIPTPTPPAVLYTTQDTLREFPLHLGAQWIYSSTNYSAIEGGGILTATFLVTDTVAAVQARGRMYAAKVVRVASLISSTRDLAQVPHGGDYFQNMTNPQAKWLIVDENKIYQQPEELDWASVLVWRLVYIFPLHQDNRWYPTAEQRALFSPYRDAWIPGVRIVLWQGEYRVPAGNWDNCFEIRESYNPGDSVEWFCDGVGIVAEQFDHAGTPFGFRSELVQFSKGN